MVSPCFSASSLCGLPCRIYRLQRWNKKMVKNGTPI
jgi:hypothetical protein